MEDKVKKAMALREDGYNCAQAVLLPFEKELGMDADTLPIISAGMGSGAGQGELCGVANALALAAGILGRDASPEGKKKAVAVAGRLGKTFSAPYGGCVTCRDLKGKCGKTCHELVGEGVKILFQHIDNQV